MAAHKKAQTLFFLLLLPLHVGSQGICPPQPLGAQVLLISIPWISIVTLQRRICRSHSVYRREKYNRETQRPCPRPQPSRLSISPRLIHFIPGSLVSPSLSHQPQASLPPGAKKLYRCVAQGLKRSECGGMAQATGRRERVES